MKNIKMTLFKKIFLIVFSGFLFIEGIQIYKSYQDGIYEYIDNLIPEHLRYNLYELKEKISTRLGWTTQELENELTTLIYNEEKNMHQGYYKISYNTRGSVECYKDIYKDGRHYINICEDEHQQGQLLVLLNDYDEDIVRKLDLLIRDSYENGEMKIIVNATPGDEDYEFTYLKVKDMVLVDGDSSTSKEYLLNMYSSPNILCSLIASQPPYYLEYQDRINEYEELLKNLNQFTNIKDTKPSEIDLSPKVSYISNDDGTYILYRIEGYSFSISYMMYKDIDMRDILTASIINRMNTLKYSLIISFLISLLISYMLTQRIYKIEKKTKQISENNFDIVLDEKPEDELGDLSKSINKMSFQLKETIEKLNKEIERVKELESLRKDFINQFTHEMKTPLGIINGYSELIEETDNEEEKERYLSIINRETNRINDLIQSMLRLSRLEAGKVELNKEELDLEDIITEVVDEYEVLLMKKNIKVEADIRDKTINGDRNQIITVLRNFISNAIKHTDSKIVITADKGIRVYNEGKHIEEERLESIWYTFVTHDKSGSGLGLAICRSILELHGYRYGVINKENGVEFYFHE